VSIKQDQYEFGPIGLLVYEYIIVDPKFRVCLITLNRPKALPPPKKEKSVQKNVESIEKLLQPRVIVGIRISKLCSLYDLD